MAIDTCVENFSGAVLKALTASTPKRRPRDDTRPPIPAGIQDDTSLKIGCGGSGRSPGTPTLKAEVNRLQNSETRRINEWRNDQWSPTLESLDHEDQCMWRMTRLLMAVRTPSPPRHPKRILAIRLRQSRSPCRQSGDSVSTGDRSFDPGSYGDG